MMAQQKTEDDKALRPTFDGRQHYHYYYVKVKDKAAEFRRLGLLGHWRDELHDLADHFSPYISPSNEEIIYEGCDDHWGLWKVQKEIDKIGNTPLVDAAGSTLLERKQFEIKNHLYRLQRTITKAVKHLLLPLGDSDERDVYDTDDLKRRTGLK